MVQLAAPWKQEIAGALAAGLGGLTLATLASISLGAAGLWWSTALRRAFGWGSWIVGLSLVFGGLHVALASVGRPWRISLGQIIGLEIVFAASLAVSHLVGGQDQEMALALASAGRGGGYVGWALSIPLADGVGIPLTWVILIAVWLLGVGLLLGVSRRDVQSWTLGLSSRMQGWADNVRQKPLRRPGEPPQMPPAQAPSPAPPAQQPPQPRPDTRPHELVIARPPRTKGRPPSRPSHLPPLNLLEAGQPLAEGEAEIKEKAATIEGTLLDFGLPVRVVEVRRGPAVTQFGVAPLYIETSDSRGNQRERKVRVGQITALSSDLALALAAPSIRMEAPVPGRPIVGIEVPNREVSLVHLRPILESEQFYRLSAPLRIGLGLDVSGTPVTADLAAMPHLLIAGTTGAGKSVCINALTTCLVCNNSPDKLRLVMIDPKMVELVRFNGLPHLLGKVEVHLDRILGVLRWLAREMDGRYIALSEVGARSLSDFNQLAGERRELRRMPNIVLVVDELADLMMMAPDEVERTLVRLAQMARAVGIHLVVSTQRPSTDVVTGLIKANFPARIAFAVATSIDSRVILDSAGAESLLGKGDMLFQAPEAPSPVRLQGCFVSDLEIERVVGYWRNQMAETEESRAAPWEDMLSRQAVVEKKDELLEEAIALAQDSTTISTSFIQRRLRIGYPRAARLMDALEELGVVGEEQAGGRTRHVLVDKDDDPLGDYLGLRGEGDG